jgi:hypothetical protein
MLEYPQLLSTREQRDRRLAGDAGPIAHQPASQCIFAELINRRHAVLRRQCHQSLSPGVEERIGAHQESGNVLAGKRGKGCFDFLIGAGIENDEPLTQRA